MTQQAAKLHTRRLIVNGDDFGQSPGINEGIIRCHEHGILTSASLMVRWPDAAAAAYARGRQTLSVGLHIDLGEWSYRDGEWVIRYAVTDVADPGAVAAEIGRQLDAFRRLMDADPTHLDSHQHVHRSAPAQRIVADLGTSLRIPVRDASDTVIYVGSFYGQGRKGEALDDAITVEHLIEIVHALPPGTTELGCHPGLRHDADGMYVAERGQEAGVLCDPRVRAAIDAEGIKLISFRDVGAPQLLRDSKA